MSLRIFQVWKRCKTTYQISVLESVH